MSFDVSVERRADHSLVLRNTQPLREDGTTLVDWLDRWAFAKGDQVFIAQRRTAGGWNELTFAQAQRGARRLGAALLEMGASQQRPVIALAPNGVTHAQMMLAALYAGVPIASVSPTYATGTSDWTKLKAVFDSLRPAVVFAEDAPRRHVR